MERAEHALQAEQDPAALRAVPHVALDARARTRYELIVEVVGHVSRSPPVIKPEARTLPEVGHGCSDPARMPRGSHIGCGESLSTAAPISGAP